MTEPDVLFRGKRFRVVRALQTMPDGSPHVREIVQHPGAVAILPILDDGRVCLIENQRVAAGRALYELPAGTLEPGEDPLAAAGRELAEETGYRAQQIEILTRFFTSPGVLSERMHLYVATGLNAGPPAREAGEDIHNRLVTWREALEMVHDGRVEDAKTIVGLLYYQAFRLDAGR
jgi:ADP-ribose pyrophosphatase